LKKDGKFDSKKPLMEEESKEGGLMDTLLTKGAKEKIEMLRKATI
jgi:hypothetical protein